MSIFEHRTIERRTPEASFAGTITLIGGDAESRRLLSKSLQAELQGLVRYRQRPFRRNRMRPEAGYPRDVEREYGCRADQAEQQRVEGGTGQRQPNREIPVEPGENPG
jgi:hypothetical protein